MTPTLRAGLLVACIAASLEVHAQKGQPEVPPVPECGRFQATWTQAQKDEYAALLAWMNARSKGAEGKAALASAEKKLQDAWRRQRTEGTRSVQPPGNRCGPKR